MMVQIRPYTFRKGVEGFYNAFIEAITCIQHTILEKAQLHNTDDMTSQES